METPHNQKKKNKKKTQNQITQKKHSHNDKGKFRKYKANYE